MLEMLGPATPGTFTPRVPSKGWLGDRIEGFVHMQQLRADFVEAVIACVTGHRMTPELAALCIATYWRRYAAIANYQESRGAAITLQAAFRGMDNRLVLKDQSDAAAKLQAVLKGRKTREKTDDELIMYRAVSRLQAVWRGHLARSYSDKLRWQVRLSARLGRQREETRAAGMRDLPFDHPMLPRVTPAPSVVQIQAAAHLFVGQKGIGQEGQQTQAFRHVRCDQGALRQGHPRRRWRR